MPLGRVRDVIALWQWPQFAIRSAKPLQTANWDCLGSSVMKSTRGNVFLVCGHIDKKVADKAAR